MGVESGVPADLDLLPILLNLQIKYAPWQATVIGRSEIWPVHQRVVELGRHLRTGLEDTFYLPDRSKADSNGPLIEQLARYARNAGREVASPQEARGKLGLNVGISERGATSDLNRVSWWRQLALCLAIEGPRVALC